MEKEKKTVLLTGATGFIGSAVLKEFISSGYHVIVLLRSLSNTKRLNGLKGFESVIYENLNDENLIRELRIKKPSIFLQMAWSGASGKYRNELFQIRDNLSLTINSVELAVATGCTHWIGIGSQAEYGNQNRRVNEKSPIEPTTIYGKIKVACCWAALGLCHAHNLKGTWLRLFDPYGPGDNPTWFIPYLIKEMLRGNAPELTFCEQLWDYIYIDDVAKANKMVVETGTGGIYNLGSGKAVSLKSVVEIIRHLLNIDIHPVYGAVDYRPDQVMHLQADISKLTNATGWVPIVELEDGLKKTVESFRSIY